jgi:hypothetical protein
MIPTYEGETYLAPSGQWSWRVHTDGADVICGAGCESEGAAWQAMYGELSGLTEESSR